MAWRDTARPARFFFLDARSAFPLVLCLLHIAWWTFITAIVSIVLFWWLERKGFSMPVFFRWIRTKLSGRIKYSTPRRLVRGLYD